MVFVLNCLVGSKSNLHYTRGITPKRVTSGGARLRALAPEQHSFRRNVTAMASRWRHCADLTGPGIEPKTSRTDSARLATELTAGTISVEMNVHGQLTSRCDLQ